MAKEKKSKELEISEHQLEPAGFNPPALIRQAIASGAGVEILEKLMALQERWERNEAKKAFDLAMAAVRSKLPKLVKNQKVDYQSAKGQVQYFHDDLAEDVEALQAILAEQGLSFRWTTPKPSQPGLLAIGCLISHAAGHREETVLESEHDHSGGKNPIQALGSASTYLQRYTLRLALGVAAARDDDGQGAGGLKEESEKSAGKEKAPASKPAKPRPLTENHKKLQAMVLAHMKKKELTPDYERKIYIQLTTYKSTKDGKVTPGVGELALMPEKLVLYATKRFNEAVSKAKTEPGGDG